MTTQPNVHTPEMTEGFVQVGPSKRERSGFLGDRRYRLIALASPILALLMWELTVRMGMLDSRFFPPPTRVAAELADMTASGELWEHLSISLKRIALGFVIGAIPGVVLGMLMGWFRGVKAALDPLVAATYPLPKIALLPLFLIIFGLGETSKVMTVATAGFFLVLITTAHGVSNLDPILIQAAENYGAKGWKLGTKVILPASLPTIFTGLRLSLGVSLLIIVAAEFVAANEGIGFLIWISWSTLRVTRMYAGLVVISILGIIFTTGLNLLGKWLTPWGQDIQNRTL